MTTEIERNAMMHTESLCPICLRVLEAFIVEENGNASMLKTCPEHGSFETVLWRSKTPMNEWIRTKERAYIKNPITEVDKGCPFDCGLCSAHRQHTCTALIEVTSRCNLSCRFCFADAMDAKSNDPTLEQVRFQFESILKVSGRCNIQLSGGEPTVRDDLAEIIRIGVELGFPFIQVNTNGIRMAKDEAYVKALKEAGLSSLFLQFDGIDDRIYETLRGRALFELKVKAIENCQKYGIGVVLVPTIVPHVNVKSIGEIIRFGISHSPTVRGVHFQPVSYFGRIPEPPKDEDRITLPEVMEHICEQMNGMVEMQSMQPPGCENALCSFNGNYLIEEGTLKPVSKRSCCSTTVEKAEEGADKAKAFVARNWSYQKQAKEEKLSDWDKILNAIANNTFSLSGMAFQDAWNVNLERIRDCCIHVSTADGRLIPFCMYNITNMDGMSLYRDAKRA
ncbi:MULTISPECIES: radical SAM (seleno)protein TrsS [unclassified Sulfurospirillum]|uniref:radical SAM (seleno)protein TrsS n=1 Tax=unclassified Sulfurospirillum TaxID=2618290 RepID=UPI000506CBEC|nr:radical SAM protein [Sulfurospirillum sp. SCADC]